MAAGSLFYRQLLRQVGAKPQPAGEGGRNEAAGQRRASRSLALPGIGLEQLSPRPSCGTLTRGPPCARKTGDSTTGHTMDDMIDMG